MFRRVFARGLSTGTRGGKGYLVKEAYGQHFKANNPSELLTRIICTVGPDTSTKVKLGEMIDAGMSAVRLNASHGDYAFFKRAIANVREVAEQKCKICPIILDTKGPEVRINSTLEENPILEMGDTFTFYGSFTDKGSKDGVSTTYDRLGEMVEVGDLVLIDDGRLSFMIRNINFTTGDMECVVIAGGELKPNKGVNIPGRPIDLPHLTTKDRKDIEFAVDHKVEFIAHSFTRSSQGILAVREIDGVVENGISVIAKIETQEALDNLDGIMKVSDGIMVARGDLGVEIPLERVCAVQKDVIRKCNLHGKFVITATEMLDSMISNPRPTRAEASDVANAVFDGTDCVMLSGETAVGKYPVEAIQVMNRICREAEINHDFYAPPSLRDDGFGKSNKIKLQTAFSMAAVETARKVEADLIIAVTKTGETARELATHFPHVPILALSISPKVCAQMCLYRGVIPYLVHTLERKSCVPRGIAKATALNLVQHGSRVILVTGHLDTVANRLESFVVGGSVPALESIPGGKYAPGSSFQAP
uniref:Pyruvate kinase n=1 Tax=Mucochytrium quahogii TaxID=96639 RepID=A0A7S2WC12_9STRA|mmetsp:Transcript_5354/g.8285  ORF Transcript_5354/g.8285 Transcript_5354/m.8285 type:complete len:534 (-) Transcript_5354:838-2439(-)